MSFGYDANTGIVERLDGFERYTGRLNINSKLNEKLSVGANIGLSYTYSEEVRDRNNVQNPILSAYTYRPYEPVYKRKNDGSLVLDDNGNRVYNETSNGFSILEALENNTEFENNIRTIASSFLQYELIDNLKFKTQFSGVYDRYRTERYTQPGSILDGITGDPLAPGSKSDEGSDQFDYSWLNQISYAKTFGKHSFNILAFTEFSKQNFSDYRLTSKGFADKQLSTQENASAAISAVTRKSEATLFSLASALDYEYADRYSVSASIRRDGASRFGKDTRYGTFWSFSLGWDVAKEEFFDSMTDVVNRLRLRTSYGVVGNWNIPNYASLGYYNFGKYMGQSAGFSRNYVGNKELTWESQNSFNIGVEYGLLNSRIYGGIDYFNNVRSDFLFSNSLSYEGGGYNQFINAGKMTTSGIELSVSGDIISTSELVWTVGANITFMDYDVNELLEPEYIVDGTNVVAEGEEPFTFKLVRYAGVDSKNGDALYYDKNGEITNKFSSGDAVNLSGKSPLADYYGGFYTNVTYKGFDLAVDFSYKAGNYIYNATADGMLADGEGGNSNQRVDAFNYWKKPGDTGVLPRPASGSSQISDRFLQDGSYLRLRNLTIGYTFPSKIIERIGLQKIRVFAQGQNLLTWTGYEGDPEISIGSGENQLGEEQEFIPGAYDQFSYPTLRTLTFGIDVKF
ncbi:MAG: SusC/RagA family TonB-linked outer membrane protein [Cytophagales bacterium]|nr:SusC/RagA family TonB-linked outer membrane protein [Cytophagales bacterium]